jgi:glycosyltransferase involved in cell wall biosynthesis
MNMQQEPLVSVITPVYNGGEFIVECIESVLNQTYRNYEYIIVNNCSTDQTLQIARRYAKQDIRLQIHSNSRLVPVIENHNIAFGLISPKTRYCKVVSADDFLFPECLARLVEFAEANPTAGVIGSYQLSGAYVRWQGFSYQAPLIPGVELCRRIFLGKDKTFGFGSPTSLLYRADLVRSSDAFYPNASPHSDTSACFKFLRNSDFGFVHQVLSYERIHAETQSTTSAQINRYASACLNDLIEYGPFYLDAHELELEMKRRLRDYHRFLAVNWLLRFRDKAFWSYHKSRLQELGYPLRRAELIRAAIVTAAKHILNPGHASRKLRDLLSSRSGAIASQARPPASSQLQEPTKTAGAV